MTKVSDPLRLVRSPHMGATRGCLSSSRNRFGIVYRTYLPVWDFGENLLKNNIFHLKREIIFDK
jgi:hypothetical protein